jgi:hypothetical protein
MRIGVLLLMGWSVFARAQSLDEASSQLAARIAAARPAASFSLVIQSQIPAVDVDKVRRSLERELENAGLHPVESGGAEIRVTMGENVRGYLLIAQIPGGERQQIAMVPWTKPATGPVLLQATLRKTLLWEDSEPILDFAPFDSSLLLLTKERLVSLAKSDDGWRPAGSIALAFVKPLSRDPRGRLIVVADGTVQILVPGTACTGTLQPLAVNCSASDQPLPEQAGGADRAEIESKCESGRLNLTTKPNDYDEQDQIQAFAFNDGKATPVTPPLVMSGPVTALWPGAAGVEANVVVRNLATGNYEASRVAIACSE